MIASQKIGKSFMHALDYNLKKLYEPRQSKRAELLASNFSSLDLNVIRQEVKWVCSLRPNLNRYVYHTSLNFLKDELSFLDNEKLLAIAQDYLRAMGFDNNQYMIFRHRDAEHPHIHLLANRIRFDGSLVSDSNNFKRSEAIVRDIEFRYNLIPVEQSIYSPKKRSSRVSSEHHNGLPVEQNNIGASSPYNVRPDEPHVTVSNDRDTPVSFELGNNVTRYRRNGSQRRAPKKNEIEMVLRTGQPSGKMLLQEKLSLILQQRKLNMQDFVQQCELNGISLLFNQASTGRISGITYFLDGFKAKGQALGNHYKWAEILKKLDYEQNRDSAAISQANSRTREKYGEFTNATEQHSIGAGKTNVELVPGERTYTSDSGRDQTTSDQAGSTARPSYGKSELDMEIDDRYRNSTNDYNADNASNWEISISDDIDDEAILGRNRRRKHMPRQNTR